MAEEFPVVEMDSNALAAVKLLAEHRLPGLVVTDGAGHPHSILPASQVVQFLVPAYVRDDPSLAAVLDEPMADRIADKLGGRKVRELLPEQPQDMAVLNPDDTIVEVAALMARLRCPLAAVVRGGQLVGVITASRLLQLALAPH